jgi:hypothetical protein
LALHFKVLKKERQDKENPAEERKTNENETLIRTEQKNVTRNLRGTP